MSKGIPAFLSEALALLPAGMKIRTVRADSGFFSGELLSFLEECNLPCVVVARMTASVKRMAAGLISWTFVDETYSVGAVTLELEGWEKACRFVMVRERIQDKKSALGRKLLDVPGYTFRVFVTNRSDDALELWRNYNQRAIVASGGAKSRLFSRFENQIKIGMIPVDREAKTTRCLKKMSKKSIFGSCGTKLRVFHTGFQTVQIVGFLYRRSQSSSNALKRSKTNSMPTDSA